MRRVLITLVVLLPSLAFLPSAKATPILPPLRTSTERAAGHQHPRQLRAASCSRATTPTPPAGPGPHRARHQHAGRAAARRRAAAPPLRERGRRALRRHPAHHQRPRPRTTSAPSSTSSTSPRRRSRRSPPACRSASPARAGAPGHIANFVDRRLHAGVGRRRRRRRGASTSATRPRRSRSARSSRAPPPAPTPTNPAAFVVTHDTERDSNRHALVGRRWRHRRLPAHVATR